MSAVTDTSDQRDRKVEEEGDIDRPSRPLLGTGE